MGAADMARAAAEGSNISLGVSSLLAAWLLRVPVFLIIVVLGGSP